MDALDLLSTRRSVRELTEPAPDELELETVFQCATQVPDHGGLTPWRFVVIHGSAAKARFRRALEDTVVQMKLGSESMAKAGKVADFAPMAIAVIAKPATAAQKPKPEWEQMLSAGAAAYAIQLATNALGYDNVWITGLWCGSPVLRQEMGCGEKDKIIGFIMVGTAQHAFPKEEKNTDLEPFVTYW
ncbi:Putative NAD(P)H nitroreductase ydjA [Kingella potus]|uniref:Putative NAD(P)H nitroreductase n=1 Tax=Kingella potus TaxID=265175 RepID=A0A377QZ95_9NEIS|nr:nitroreductase family protein [Kingella potus]STQ99898.1 Putative NAD(P)H nitroreductase ydjA [Kingella potus]